MTEGSGVAVTTVLAPVDASTTPPVEPASPVDPVPSSGGVVPLVVCPLLHAWSRAGETIAAPITTERATSFSGERPW